MRSWTVLLLVTATSAAAQPAPAPQAAESVTVTATPLPGRSAVDEFIYSYPHVTRLSEKIPRWKDGICPVVEGVPARYAAFVTARLKAIAQKAGAPVNADPKCRHNIEILFSDHPQEVGDFLAKGHSPYLGWFDNLHQADDLAKVTHDVQAWYLTATVDYNGAWHIDLPRANFFYNNSYGFTGGNDGDYLGFGRIGGRINNGIASYLYNVIVVADSGKLKQYEMGALADYIAMLALSHPKRFDACWEVPSITNLLAKDCEPDRKTATLSDNDAAFLQGLYKMAPGDSEFSQRAEIRYFVERQKQR
jgi:hypothetical protein